MLNAIECALARKDNKSTDFICEKLQKRNCATTECAVRGNECMNLTGTDSNKHMLEPSDSFCLEPLIF